MKNEEMMSVVDKMRVDLDRIYKDLTTEAQQKEARRAIGYLGRLLGELKNENN